MEATNLSDDELENISTTDTNCECWQIILDTWRWPAPIAIIIQEYVHVDTLRNIWVNNYECCCTIYLQDYDLNLCDETVNIIQSYLHIARGTVFHDLKTIEVHAFYCDYYPPHVSYNYIGANYSDTKSDTRISAECENTFPMVKMHVAFNAFELRHIGVHLEVYLSLSETCNIIIKHPCKMDRIFGPYWITTDAIDDAWLPLGQYFHKPLLVSITFAHIRQEMCELVSRLMHREAE